MNSLLKSSSCFIWLLLLASTASALPNFSSSSAPADYRQEVNQPTEPTNKQYPTKLAPISKSSLLNSISTENAVKSLIPFSPEDIIKLRNLLSATEHSKKRPLSAPQVLNRSITVSPKPGSALQQIFLSPGYVSTVVILDKHGSPWPITKMISGSAQDFSYSQILPNAITISPTSEYAYSNIVLVLEGMPTPISLTLTGSPDKVDYKTEVRIDRSNPNSLAGSNDDLISMTIPYTNNEKYYNLSSANSFLSEQAINTTDIMNMILDGIPPKSFKPLRSTAPFHLESWYLNDMLYLRTSKELISPAYLSKIKSSDGTTLYRVPKIYNLLFLVNGRVSAIKLGGN